MLMPTRERYSDAEIRADAAIHLLGLGVVTVAVPLMLGVALALAWTGAEGWLLAVVGVYALAFLAMIGASALYNLYHKARLAWLYRRLDHSAIYFKIAGTYTPLTLIPGQGTALVTGLWAVACAGIALKLWSPSRFRVLALTLYLGMGWAGVIILPGLWASLPPGCVMLIFGGGLTYTLGVAFYLTERLPYHYAIWHVCVLLASLMVYAGVMWLLLLRLAG